MNSFKINGRWHWFYCETLKIRKGEGGRHFVTTDKYDHEILIRGGFAAGGGHNEWCVQNPADTNDFWPCKSLAHGLRIILNV